MTERLLDPATLEAMRASAPVLHNGTYTVSHAERGHFTAKVHTAQNGDLAGKRIISVLVGPDNTSDYTGVAFWDDEKRRAIVWKRWRGAQSNGQLDGRSFQSPAWSAYEEKLAILIHLALYGSAGSERCQVCGGHDFTRETPESPWACARCLPPRYRDVEWRPKVEALGPLEVFDELAKAQAQQQGRARPLPGTAALIAHGYTLQRASRCMRCNRELTHPESLALGVGPDCAGRER